MFKRLQGLFRMLAWQSRKPIGDAYQLPARCTRWIVVSGPSIASPGHRATVLIEASSILDWARHHANAIWCNNRLRQAAREYLPDWLAQADTRDESVTLPDCHMSEVLLEYASDLTQVGRARCWCPDCGDFYPYFTQEMVRFNDPESPFASAFQWRCLIGHLVYEKRYGWHDRIRIIRPETLNGLR